MLTRVGRLARREKRIIRYVAAKLLTETGISRRIIIDRDGYKVVFHPAALSTEMWVYGSAIFKREEEFLRKYLRAGDHVVDVGANIGALSLFAASKVEDEGRVISIEAHPKTYKYLCENVRLNGARNIKCVNAAVGSESGMGLFSDLKADDMNGIIDDGRGYEVEIKRLDDICEGIGRIDCIKVDVEGYEMQVFYGAEKCLRRAECVYYESYERNYEKYGFSASDVINHLDKIGFSILRILGDGCVELITEKAQDYKSNNCENLVAVRDMESFLIRTNYKMVSN